MWERSDGLAVFANSFRQAAPFVPIRPTFVPFVPMTWLGEGYIGGSWSYPQANGIIGGSGGLPGPGTCTIDLNQSKVYTNPSTHSMDDPNSGTPWPHTNLYLDLWTGLDATAQGTLPLNIYLDPQDILTQGQAGGQVGSWSVPSLSVSPTSQAFLGAGGPWSAIVTVPSNATWTATTNAGWITFSSASGTGSGTLQYQVALNPVAWTPRTGTITVASQGLSATITITQAAMSPNPPSAALTNTLTNGNLPNQATQTLAIAVGDPNGPAYIGSISILINNTINYGYYSCQMIYYPQSNQFYFIDMDSPYPLTLGTPGVFSGAHCGIDAGNSSVVINPSSSVASMTLNLKLTLQPSALGTQGIEAVVFDNSAGNPVNSSYLGTLATWPAFSLLTPNGPAVSMDPSPVPTAASSQMLHYEISDGNGYTFLNSISGQLAPYGSAYNAPCYFLYYFPNFIYLYQVVNSTPTLIGRNPGDRRDVTLATALAEIRGSVGRRPLAVWSGGRLFRAPGGAVDLVPGRRRSPHRRAGGRCACFVESPRRPKRVQQIPDTRATRSRSTTLAIAAYRATRRPIRSGRRRWTTGRLRVARPIRRARG